MRLILSLTLLLSLAIAQGQVIEGIVRDSKTGEPVAGAHVIGLGASRSGTSTNGEGIFLLHNAGSVDSLRVSCIGYRTLVVRSFTEGQKLALRLTPHIISLDALTVKPPSPLQLIRDAVLAIPRNYFAPPFQVRGFYREIIRNDTTYYSVAEAVFESQLPEAGEDKASLKLVQGRRSESVKATRIFEDYHPGGGPNYLLNNLFEARVPEFLLTSEFEDYGYAIDSITSYEGRDVYVIGFDQRDGVKKNLWKGTIYIESESLAIIELRYALSEKGIEFRKHLTGTDKVMANLLGIDFTVIDRSNRYSYRMEGGRWRLHDAVMFRTIHFRQPRKNIDETFSIQAQLLSLGQRPGPLVPFEKDEVWQRNQLVKNLPGEFDEQFWGANNIIRPEEALTAAVARMDVLRQSALPSGIPDGWSLHRAQDARVYQRQETYYLKPYVTSHWKDTEQGPFLWKPAEGDFELQARVRITKAQDTTAAVDMGFQTGGLMVRRTNSEAENNVFFGLGCMGNPQHKLVSQHTIEGNSALYVTKVDGNEFTLRLRRKGSLVELHYLNGPGQWIPLRQFKLTGWPTEVQVGIAGFAFVPGNGPKRRPDLLVRAQGVTITSLKP